MPASITVSPLLPGRLEEWKAFYRELSGPRRAAWAQSQRRRGIRREAVWLIDGTGGPEAVMLAEGEDPSEARRALAESDDPFDVWLRDRLKGLTGPARHAVEVFDSRPRPGIWREWRAGRRT